MNIITLQIILLFFALFMIYSLFIHWKKKNISDRMFLIWILIFGGFVFVTFFPKLLEPLIKELFIIRVMDLGMIVTFMILTYITIENNIKIKGLEMKMEKLVRKLAIRKVIKKK